MFKGRSILPVIFFLFFCTALPAIGPGQSFPSFSVVSGDGKILISSDLEGRDTFLFYQDRTELDVNRDLKAYLQDWSFPDDSVRMVVIADCSHAGLRKKIWENQLQDSSRRSGYTIYGDWSGRMKQDLSAPDGASLFYHIDPEGIVRYFKEGTVPEGDFKDIQASLNP